MRETLSSNLELPRSVKSREKRIFVKVREKSVIFLFNLPLCFLIITMPKSFTVEKRNIRIVFVLGLLPISTKN